MKTVSTQVADVFIQLRGAVAQISEPDQRGKVETTLDVMEKTYSSSRFLTKR